MMDDIMKEYSLLLLAGGKSSRMGQDKGNLIYKGKTFIDVLLDKGEQIGMCNFYLSGCVCDRIDVSVVPDEYRDCGPLGGLQACMKAMKTPYCLVLPVDVPQIPVWVLRELIAQHRKLREENAGVKALIVKHGEQEEPLIGIYATQLGTFIEENIKEQKYSVFCLLNRVGYQVLEIEIEGWQIDNINTPQSYERLLEVSK